MAKKFDSSKFTNEAPNTQPQLKTLNVNPTTACSFDRSVVPGKCGNATHLGPIAVGKGKAQDLSGDMCRGDSVDTGLRPPHPRANGESVTLYDFKPGGSGERYGDPIADAYAVIARANNAILAIADGSDWGPQTREAARSAAGAQQELVRVRREPRGQRVLRVEQQEGDRAGGDVQRLGQRAVSRTRKRGQIGGQNVTCTAGFLPVHENDTVFLVTNGIIQNFDPVVLLEATANDKADRGSPASEPVALPVAQEGRVFERYVPRGDSHQLRDSDYGREAEFLERCWSDVDYINAEDRSSKEHEILKIADDYPGKLDHATAVAYKVGYLTDGQRHTIRKAYFYSPTE
eukprot:Em0562g2a